MWIVKMRGLGRYLIVSAMPGREFVMVDKHAEKATPLSREAAESKAKGANLMFGTDIWEAVKL